MVPLIIGKSERLNDSVLKIQYFILITFYCLLGLILAIPVIPLLYLKAIVNSVYILFNNKREQFKGQNIINLALTIFVTPAMIFLSLFMDIISLPD